MIQMAYYPGCALQSMNWDYRESIKHVVGALGIELIEVEDWTCCGATAAHSLDEHMSVYLPAWNLAFAEKHALDMVLGCPMCFKRFALTRKLLKDKRLDDPWSMKLNFEINDLARFLAGDPWINLVRKTVRRPLRGMRLVSYYGCQVLRPPKITGYADYENPTHLDRLVEATGAVAIDWSFKGTCCGASIGIPKKEIGLDLVKRLLVAAHNSGAQAIVVCCPLCQSNLDLLQPEIREVNGIDWSLPILYYTELLGIAFALEEIQTGLASHLVDPRPLIRTSETQPASESS